MTTEQHIFFAHRYFRQHAEENPLVGKCYIEKATHHDGIGPSPGLKQRPKYPTHSKVLFGAKTYQRPVSFVYEVQPDSEHSPHED